MPIKTWFQHDMNCRKKEGLSALIKIGGNEAYGQFWRLQELYMEMQIHKETMTDYFIINQNTLLKELGINSRRIEKLFELFSETCAIQFEKISKRIGKLSYINWKVTLPKSLIFINQRNQKTDNQTKLNKTKLNENKTKLDNSQDDWKSNFSIYQNQEQEAYNNIIANKDFIIGQQKYYPNIDIILTLEKAHVNFWNTEAGWKNKKLKHTKEIDWKRTFINALSQKSNWVYLQKDTFKNEPRERNKGEFPEPDLEI